METVDDELAIPETFALHQNYPNPLIQLQRSNTMPEVKNIQIIIYDIMGRKVCTLVNKFQDIDTKPFSGMPDIICPV